MSTPGMHFVCPDCGPHVKADEDWCCTMCGRDCNASGCRCEAKAARLATLREVREMFGNEWTLHDALVVLAEMIAKEEAK